MCGCSRYALFRRIGTAFLAVVLIPALLTGCGEPKEEPNTMDPLLESHLQKGTLTYFKENPIEIKEYIVKSENFTESGDIIDSDKAAVKYQSLQISGLKDEAVQKKINQAIQETCEDMAGGIAPYRGVKKSVGDWPLKRDGITAYAGADFNNILSIYMQRCTSFEDPEEKTEYEYMYHDMVSVTDQRCLNFDLNTGEQFSLQDVFIDGFDYLSFLNDRVAEEVAQSFGEDEVYSPSGSLKLAGPFTGLKEDQKFYIQSGGQLILVFDYDTPEFVREWYDSYSLPVFYDECQGNMFLPQRFWNTESDLFVSKEAPVYFFPLSSQTIDVLVNDGGEEEGGLLSYNRQFNCDARTPEALREVLLQKSQIDSKELQSLKERCLAAGSTEGGSVFGYYSLSGFADVVDRYCSLSNDEYWSVCGEQVFQQVECACYDLYSMKQLRLADIFKEGFDYKEVVIEAYLKQLEETEGLQGAADSEQSGAKDSMTREELKAYLLEHSESWEKNFRISTDGLDIVLFSASEKTEGLRSTWVSFEEIGCSHLKLFQ